MSFGVEPGGAAWVHAQVLTLGRLESVAVERNAARALVAELSTRAAELGLAKREIERVTTAAAAATLAEREAKIKLQTLQAVLDKAIGEVSDYKNLLARLAPIAS